MDAIFGDAPSSHNAIDWDAICEQVNAWRGVCVHHYSTVEMAVTETLLVLSQVAPEGSVGRRHLIGQRLEDLSAAISGGGPFAELGKNVQGDLRIYRDKHEAFRTVLCHGVIKVTVERNGRWMLFIQTLAFRSGVAERHAVQLDQTEAEARLDDLKRDGRKLTSMLGQLRKVATQSA